MSTPTKTVLVKTPTNPFGVPIVTDHIELDEEEYRGRPKVEVPPFSSREMEVLHVSACQMCSPGAALLSAEEVVEEIIKRVAPEHAKDVRPTPKKLLSGTGAFRPQVPDHMRDVPQEQLAGPITPAQARERYEAGLHLTDNTRKVIGLPSNPPSE